MADLRSDDADIDGLLGDTFARVGESPTILEQTARLQAMIDAARGAPKPIVDPTSLPVRFSRLKAFSLSPAHYLLWCQDTFEETLATRLGSGAHAALFEDRELVCYDGRRAGKAWERFERRVRDRDDRAVILNANEYAIAAGMVDAVKRHERAMELLFDGTKRELTIDWSIGARACRSTPDTFAKRRHVTDLKTARSCEPRWLAREALRRHYHAQLSFYGDAIEHDGDSVAEQYIVAVENDAPHNVVVLRIPDATRAAASKLCRQWWEQLQLAEHTGQYGGYVESDIDLELPDYEIDEGRPKVVEIDGKHVFVA